MIHLSNQKSHANFAPNLKRTLSEHHLLKKDMFDKSTTSSITRQIKTNVMPKFSAHKTEFDGKTMLKGVDDSTFTEYSTNSDEMPDRKEEAILKVQSKIAEIIEEDIRHSTKIKDKKSYTHMYEQKQENSNIFVSQPKWIPKQILTQHQKAERQVQRGQSVNFLQGFIKEIGFMFYAVQRKVFFYDIQTINQDSICPLYVETEQKILNAFYGIQVLNIGPPYMINPKKVLAFFHVNQVELYQFSIVRDIQCKQRSLQIKPLNISYIIEQLRPTKLVMDSKGVLYYVDNKGQLKFIRYDHSIINKAVSQITTTSKRVNQQLKQFWKNMTINVAKNIIYFTKTIINFSRTLFTQNIQKTDLQYDQHRDLLFLYQCNQIASRRYKQVLKVYNTTFQKPLYVLEQAQFLDRNSIYDTVQSLKSLQSRLNSEYNLVLLMDNGKRIYLDLTTEGSRKTVTYQAPPTTTTKGFQEISQFNRNRQTLETSIIDQSFLVALFCGSGTFNCSLIRDQYSTKYEVVYKMNVELHGSPKDNQYFLYKRELDVLGPVKQGLIKNEQKTIKAKDMNLQVQGAFYRPQQLVHASDKMVQRITILRPVDILFSIVNDLQNISQISRGLQIAFGDFRKDNMIGLCCQILLDEQGAYYKSQEQVLNIKIKINVRIEPYERRCVLDLDEYLYRNISISTKARLEELIIDLAGQNIGKSKEQKEITVASGIIVYMSKLLKTVWYSNINDLSNQTCKSVLLIIQNFDKMFKKFKQRIRSQINGMLTAAHAWIEQFRQLLILVKTVTTLPDKTLHEAMTMKAQDFHGSIFAYLDNYCQPRQAQQLRKYIPFYVNEDFIKNFKLNISIKSLQTKQQKFALCRQQAHIPQYLVKHLSKGKQLEELKFMFDENHISAHEARQYFQNVSSYKQILKCLRQASSTLIQKQILLEKAYDKLRQEAKYNEQMMREGQDQIEQLAAYINLQKLLKEFYNKNKEESENWGMKMSRRVSESRKSQKQNKNSIDHLELFICDFETLSDLIDYSGDPLLDIAFANYFKPNERLDKIRTMIQNTAKQSKNFKAMIPKLKQQLEYLIVKIKNGPPRQVLIKIYLEELSELSDIVESINSEQGITEKQMYFILSYVVQLTGQPEKLYEWVIKTQKQLIQDTPKFLYLNACNLYLVKKYLPQKRQQLSERLSKITTNEVIFKKMVILLNQDSPCTK